MNFEEAEIITIKMKRSLAPDGKFYPAGMIVYIDDEVVPFVTGFKLDAYVKGDVSLLFEYLETNEDGEPIHDDKGYSEKVWEHKIAYVPGIVLEEDEDEIELVEEEELDE